MGRGGRIAPACAGKSLQRGTLQAFDGDHPRMCGEKIVLDWSAGEDEGITPACAGKSRPPGAAGVARPDHPRMCGEKLAPLLPTVSNLGSPPHVRGKV